MLPSFPLSVKSNNLHQKKVKEVQQTVFEKPADSFKPAWLTLPDSFKIPQNPCQTVLIFFGFLFTPALNMVVKDDSTTKNVLIDV